MKGVNPLKITFVRKKAYPLFFSKVPVLVDGELVAQVKNGGDYLYEGPATSITLKGPGVVRNVTFELDVPYDEFTVEFKIAMGLMAGGFIVKILYNGEVIRKLRKTF